MTKSEDTVSYARTISCNSNTHSSKIYLQSHEQSLSPACPSHDEDPHKTLEESCFLRVGMFSGGKGRTDETSMATQRTPSISKWTKEDVVGGQGCGAELPS